MFLCKDLNKAKLHLIFIIMYNENGDIIMDQFAF